jgi:hypothetical protein
MLGITWFYEPNDSYPTITLEFGVFALMFFAKARS